MKSLRQTSSKQKYYYLLLQLGILSPLMMIVGVISFSDVAAQRVLSCSRSPQQSTQGQCIVTTTTLRGQDQQIVPIRQIRGSEVIQIGTSKGIPMYRIYLKTSQDQVAVLDNSTTLNELERKTDQINTFLSNPFRIRLLLQEDTRLPFYLMGLILMTLGGLTLALTVAEVRASWKS